MIHCEGHALRPILVFASLFMGLTIFLGTTAHEESTSRCSRAHQDGRLKEGRIWILVFFWALKGNVRCGRASGFALMENGKCGLGFVFLVSWRGQKCFSLNYCI